MIFALCGRPGCGKSTLAAVLAQRHKAIVFSVDALMLQLFGEIPDRSLFEDKLTRCKDYIYSITDQVLVNSSANVIFDFGFWARAERAALRERFAGHKLQFVYLNPGNEVTWQRIEQRNATLKPDAAPESYTMDRPTWEFLAGKFEEFADEEEYIEYSTLNQLQKIIRRHKL
jgi:predicted kinase